jgi:hypothetical protein
MTYLYIFMKKEKKGAGNICAAAVCEAVETLV